MHVLFKNWQQQHKKELQPPLIALPTVILFGVAVTLFTLSIYACSAGTMPYWLGFLISCICQFLMFTVLHDASHRALSQISWLNEVIGTIAAIILTPIAGIKVFRFIHMQHHRFTNAGYELDPDQWSAKGSKWVLPFRWVVFDLHYIRWYLAHWANRPKRERYEILVIIPTSILMIAILTWFGYGWQVLWLWLLSSRIAQMMLIATFDYLPHVPHDTTAQDNELHATNIRPNKSWLMTPLVLGQNYHLIHHLFPRIPFYRYRWAWRQLKPTLIASNARILDWRNHSIYPNTDLPSVADNISGLPDGSE